MSTHNIQFHDKIRKNPVFLSYCKNFVGTEKRVRIIHGKRAIRVRAIEGYTVSLHWRYAVLKHWFCCIILSVMTCIVFIAPDKRRTST